MLSGVGTFGGSEAGGALWVRSLLGSLSMVNPKRNPIIFLPNESVAKRGRFLAVEWFITWPRDPATWVGSCNYLASQTESGCFSVFES